MSNYVNETGRICTDPVITSGNKQDGTPWKKAKFRIAVPRPDAKKRQQAGQDGSHFFNVVAWDRDAEKVEVNGKGTVICIEGRLENNRYIPQGKTEMVDWVEIVASHILPVIPITAQNQNQGEPQQTSAPAQQPPAQTAPPPQQAPQQAPQQEPVASGTGPEQYEW